MTTIFQGDDRKVQFTIIAASGSPQNIASLTNLLIHIKNANGDVIEKFSLNVRADYSTITTVSAAGGLVEIKLLRSMTQFYPNGDISAEVLIQGPDIEFPDGFHSIGQVQVAKVRPSTLSSVST